MQTQIRHSSGAAAAAVAFAAAAAVAVAPGNESTNRRTLRARPALLRVEELGETARRANAAPSPSGAEVFKSARLLLIAGAEARGEEFCVGGVFCLCVCVVVYVGGGFVGIGFFLVVVFAKEELRGVFLCSKTRRKEKRKKRGKIEKKKWGTKKNLLPKWGRSSWWGCRQQKQSAFRQKGRCR